MNPRLVVAPIVLGGLLVGGYFIDRSRSESESRLSGYFENEPTQVSSRLGGRVTKIFVKEGDTVATGRPLVEMEDLAYERSVAAQNQAAAAAQAELKETKKGPRQEDIDKQRAVVAEAQADYQKLIDGPQPEDIRSARDRLAQTTALYQKAVRGPRPDEIASARAAERLAWSKLQEALNGPTAEERAELKARLAEAQSAEVLARKNLDRSRYLFDQDAISQQQLDTSRDAYQEALNRSRDAAQTLKRAQEGTRTEEIEQARQSWRQAQAQLRLLLVGNRKEDIEAAKEDMRMARESLDLLLSGSRREDIASAKARVDQAKQALLELLQGSREEDIQKAKAAQLQARFEAKSSQTNLKERTVYAPIDGQVDRVLVADGDLMTANAPVIQMSDPTDIWLRVYLPEDQLAKVAVGDRADLVVDGVPGVLGAKVESIATRGEFTPANLQSPDERGKQVFAIRIRLAARDPRVKAGMYATVRRVGQWP